MKKRLPEIFFAILLVMIAGALLAGATMMNAEACAMPQEEWRAEGGLALSDAPMEELKLAWMRVDVRYIEQDESGMLWADVWTPWPPGEIKDLMLYDGHRMIHGKWAEAYDGRLITIWRMEEIKRLDSTVGIYLMAVFD